MYLNHKDLPKYWVIDIETDSLDASKILCMVVKNAATHKKMSLLNDDDIKRFFDELPRDSVFVGHYALSFDFPTLSRLLGVRVPIRRVVDTHILSSLYHPRLEGGHSLDSWAQRVGLKKSTFAEFGELSPELLARCDSDVEITHRVWLYLTQQMTSIGYSERSCEIEHSIRHIINQQQRRGFAFDVGRATSFRDGLRNDQESLGSTIRELFPRELTPCATYNFRLKDSGEPYASYDKHVAKYPKVVRDGGVYTCYDWEEFNIASPPQRLQKLLGLGWTPKRFTPKGNPQVDEESLLGAAESLGKPELKAIADWLVVFGRANMVQTWLDHAGPDGRIHGTIGTCAAGSRRMIHYAPNTANIPSNEAKYGRECRSLWTASDGRVLCGYDAKSLQMRIFGHYLGNPEAAELYIQGDPHTRNAEIIGQGETRANAKNHFYAFIFGAQDPKLGKMVNKDRDFGAHVRSGLYQSTPGLQELVDRATSEYKSGGGRLKCLDGGYVVCPSPHAALNYYIQPGEAVIMKQAAIYLDQKIKKKGLDAWKVGDIHDEAQMDCLPEEAAETGSLACQALIEAGESFDLTVPIEGDYKIGQSWAETH